MSTEHDTETAREIAMRVAVLATQGAGKVGIEEMAEHIAAALAEERERCAAKLDIMEIALATRARSRATGDGKIRGGDRGARLYHQESGGAHALREAAAAFRSIGTEERP